MAKLSAVHLATRAKNDNNYFPRLAIESTIVTPRRLHFIIKKSASRFIPHTRTQDSQREPSVKTLCSPLSATLRRHCVLSGGTQRPFYLFNINEKYIYNLFTFVDNPEVLPNNSSHEAVARLSHWSWYSNSTRSNNETSHRLSSSSLEVPLDRRA